MRGSGIVARDVRRSEPKKRRNVSLKTKATPRGAAGVLPTQPTLRDEHSGPPWSPHHHNGGTRRRPRCDSIFHDRNSSQGWDIL